MGIRLPKGVSIMSLIYPNTGVINASAICPHRMIMPTYNKLNLTMIVRKNAYYNETKDAVMSFITCLTA